LDPALGDAKKITARSPSPFLDRSIPAALLVGAMTARNFSDKAVAENK
jgi:hypothetical protein